MEWIVYEGERIVGESRHVAQMGSYITNSVLANRISWMLQIVVIDVAIGLIGMISFAVSAFVVKMMGK